MQAGYNQDLITQVATLEPPCDCTAANATANLHRPRISASITFEAISGCFRAMLDWTRRAPRLAQRAGRAEWLRLARVASQLAAARVWRICKPTATSVALSVSSNSQLLGMNAACFLTSSVSHIAHSLLL